MVKCSYCGKEIVSEGKVISIDGDFVCGDDCHKKFHNEITHISNMDNKEFGKWIHSEENKNGRIIL